MTLPLPARSGKCLQKMTAEIRRGPKEAAVLRELAIAALDLRIVEGGVDDRGAEVIEHDATRDAAEGVEGGAVQAQRPSLAQFG